MENEKTNGQYGKRNPQFMYQGTAGYDIRAPLTANAQTEQGAQAFKAEPHRCGPTRCGTSR